MISLEQIKQLESRVHSAVDRIRTLTAENTTLKERLASYEQRIDELELVVAEFKSDQQEIEAGILAALSQLDGLEDAVAESRAKPAAAPAAKAEHASSPQQDVRPAMAPDNVAAGDQEEPERSADASEDEEYPADAVEAESDASADGEPESDADESDESPDEDEPELDIF